MIYSNCKFSSIKKNSLISILLIGSFFCNYSQQVAFIGNAKDTPHNPLLYVNILAIPNADNQDVKFAITEKDGSYKLGLVKNQTYELTVSFLGYKPQTHSITTTVQNLTKNFILKVNPDQLDEVNIKYTPPITVKKDTITYDVTKFVTEIEKKEITY